MNCPECNEKVEAGWTICPACEAELRECATCGRILRAKWKRCPHCAAGNAQRKAARDAGASEQPTPVIGIGNDNVMKIGDMHVSHDTHIHGETEPQVVECPLCGAMNRLDSTFRCVKCSRGHLCKDHLVKELKCCEECAASQRKKEAEIIAVREAAERERLARETAERERLARETAERERLARAAADLARRAQMPQEGKPFAMDLGGGLKLDLVWIRPGAFAMGSNESSSEQPVHRVTISKGFWMGKYQVTQEQWQQVMGSNPSDFKGERNLPVEQVNWYDCKEFCGKVTEKMIGEDILPQGWDVRLPTEAEWEYACRAETRTKYITGDNESDLAHAGWYSNNSGSKTHPVGQKQSNAWGLHDMHGNVWEWCKDAWHDSYSGSPTDGSAWTGDERASLVVRGGSWYDNAYSCRSAYRCGSTPDCRVNAVGVRVVVSAPRFD